MKHLRIPSQTCLPTLELETAVFQETNLRHIAGLDEAGRGALAGPVVAAAVILPLNQPHRLQELREVDDSKRLAARARERLYTLIVANVLTYGVSMVSAAIVDRIGIIAATKRAMATAVAQLDPAAQYLLIDGRIRLQNISLPQQAIIRGDSHSLTIAAASILAKVTRDRHMIALDAQYPQYGFGRHKGYGTPQHLAALAAHGPTPIHRHTFAPIRRTLL